MIIEDQTKKVQRALRVKPQTAAELAIRSGFGNNGRALNRTIASMKANGQIAVVGKRPTTYAKTAF